MQATLQGAGYRGCRTGVVITKNSNIVGNYAWDFAQPIIGYDNVGSGTQTLGPPPSLTIQKHIQNTDIITVRGITGPADVVTLPMATTASAITLSGNNSFGQGSILMISDCNGKVDVFQKTDVAVGTAAHNVLVADASGGTAISPNLSTAYGTTASVVAVGTTTFYLRIGAAGVAVVPSSLYVIQGANAPLELVEGVDGMQILYGVTTNGDTSANQYLTAANVQAGNLWPSVMSVRVALLLRTVNIVTRNPDTNAYNLLGVNYGPFNDLRLRRIFTTTITLRNRSF